MSTCASGNGTTKIYIFRLNLTGHFRSNEIKSAGTVSLNTGKICADSQRNFISARARTELYCCSSSSKNFIQKSHASLVNYMAGFH